MKRIVGEGQIHRAYGIQADSYELLMPFLHRLRDEALGMQIKMGEVSGGVMIKTELPPFLKIALSCGCVREWEFPADVPDVTVPCSCGNLPYEHFFIKYTNEGGKDRR